MHDPCQTFKPFHLAVLKGPRITVGNYFNSSHVVFHYILGSILLFQCCFNAVLESYHLNGRLSFLSNCL